MENTKNDVRHRDKINSENPKTLKDKEKKGSKIYPDVPKENEKNVNKIYSKVPKEKEKKGNKIYPDVPKENEKNEYDNDLRTVNDNDKTNTDDILFKVGSCWKEIVFVLCVIFFIIITLFIGKKYIQTVIQTHHTYNELLEEIKKDFSSQTDFSWKIINATIFDHIYNHMREKPTVMNLLGSTSKVNNLIRGLSTIFTRLDFSAECSAMSGFSVTQDTDDMKMAMERAVSEARQHKSRCLHVPHLDLVPASLGPHLHGLTDEISAKYKDFLFIFSVSDDNLRGVSDREAERRLTAVLENAWVSEMGEERFAALVVRVVVNVVVVR